MLTIVERNLYITGSRIFGKFSAALESTHARRRPDDDNNDAEDFMDKNQDYERIRSDTDKSLRVAIIGLPNVGKSTLINRLINRPICATASRVHLTRAKADAVYSEKDTQLVFIDTPGLVSAHEFKKFKLEESFRSDSAEAMESADIVGVVQDVSNIHTRGIIHNRVLELLKMSRVGVPSLLIMNKIDLMKRKKELLSLVRSLSSEQGWPNFSDVFMVSSLSSDGIEDLRNYLLDSAKNRDWDYAPNIVTNQAPENIIKHSVRAKFMDSLPQEIPYQLKTEIEYLRTCEDGTLSCYLIVTCPSDRISKIVLGKGGQRIKAVARESEQELSNAFRTAMRLKIAVHFKEPKV